MENTFSRIFFNAVENIQNSRRRDKIETKMMKQEHGSEL